MVCRETAPLAVLRQHPVQDTEPDQVFDDLTLLASQICGTPIAFMAVLDESRRSLEAWVGIEAAAAARDLALRAHAIQQDGLFVVADTLDDDRVREHPLVVGEPRIRFCAGSPLVTRDGHAVGTLCVIDRVPRMLTSEQRAALAALSRQAVAQLELRRNLRELARALHGRGLREAAQRRLVQEQQRELASAKQLGALLQFCSACEFDMTVPANPAAIRAVTEGVAEALRSKVGVFGREFEIELALQEALANAIRHGCQGDTTKSVRCCVTCQADGDVRIVVRDPGRGFDVTDVANPLDGDNLLKADGRGIFLMNQLMDEVRFADDGRELHLRKALRVPER
jgi:anti-sigma regulatory factor (Ser/Thr protein kinase)